MELLGHRACLSLTLLVSTSFQSGGIHFYHSRREYVDLYFSPVFGIFPVFIFCSFDVSWCLIGVVVCFSLFTNEVGGLSWCSQPFWIFSLVKSLFKFCTYVSGGLFPYWFLYEFFIYSGYNPRTINTFYKYHLTLNDLFFTILWWFWKKSLRISFKFDSAFLKILWFLCLRNPALL